MRVAATHPDPGILLAYRLQPVINVPDVQYVLDGF